jgi:EmrB/QacA subfamily drug resistance transporter
VFTGFLLTSTVTMPIWGRLSDFLGRRKAYLIGLSLFLLGSALSGLSESMTQLVGFRALQGLGAGSLMTIGMTVVGDLYQLEQRARMQGYFSGVWGVASLVGPLLGGLLTDHVSWRWVFYINLPFGLLAAVAISWGLAGLVGRSRRLAIDYSGAALFTLAISALMLALVEAGREAAWRRPSVLGLLALAVALVPALIVVERRAEAPLIPLDLFKSPVVRAAAVTGFLAGMAMFGALSYIPLYIQAVLGGTATQAGMVLVPFVLGWVSFSVVSARAVLRVGYRGLVVAGMASLTLSFALLTGWDQSVSQLAAVRDVLLAGSGMGLIMVPMLIAVQSAVPKADLGAATSMTQFFRVIGGAVGIAVMGAALAFRLQVELAAIEAQAGGGLAAEVVELVRHPDLIVNPLTRASLNPAVVAEVRLALARALHQVFVLGLVVSVVALASAFLVPPGRARDLALSREPASASRS